MGKQKEIRVVIVRHGEARGEARSGELGRPLTALGRKQAERVAKRLSKEQFDHIYTSDLSRAYHTALAIRKFHKTTPLTVTKDIREVTNFHHQPGRTPRRKEVQAVIHLEREAVERFLRRLLRHRSSEQVLLVIHGNLIQFLLAKLAGINAKRSIPVGASNTSVTILTLQGGSLKLVNLLNCVKHLLPQQITGEPAFGLCKKGEGCRPERNP